MLPYLMNPCRNFKNSTAGISPWYRSSPSQASEEVVSEKVAESNTNPPEKDIRIIKDKQFPVEDESIYK